MSAINVNSITGRTGAHGPVLTGITTATNGIHVTGGSVGIGTDNPAAELEVYGNGRFKATDGSHGIELYPDVGGLGYQRIISYNRTTSAYENLSIGVNDFIVTNGSTSESLRINSSGNVGINTNAIDANLEVHTAASKINTQTIKTSAGAGGYAGLAFMAGQTIAGREKAALYFQETNNGAHYTGDLVFALNNDSGSAVQVSTSDERLRITSSGDLGIGTATPAKRLEIAAASNQDGILIKNTGSIFGALDFDSNRSGANQVLGDIRFLWNGTAVARIIGEGGSDTTNKDDGHLTFYTASAGTPSEKARIDSSGRLLVGTNTDAGSARLAVIGGGGGSSLYGEAFLGYDGTTPSTGSPTIGALQFGTKAGNQAALIVGLRDGGTWTEGSSHPGRLNLYTTADGASSSTLRMGILSGGNVLFYNQSQVSTNSDNVTTLGANGARWSAVWAANGTIQTSDERLKTEVTNSSLASDFIKALRPVSYKWIEGGKSHTGEYDEDNNWVYESTPGQRTHWGFIAQEVKQVADDAGVDFGGWVLGDKDDPESTQSLRYDQFIAPLTAALQEALAKIETLEAEVTALKGA